MQCEVGTGMEEDSQGKTVKITTDAQTTGGERTSQMRKRVRVSGEKVCEVCGDKALAHHFGALTCETCKAFFRRNARRQAALKPCQLEQRCEINKLTRRACSSCRLNKCFAVGMDADLIFDDDQKRELMEKVRKSREDRQHQQISLPCSSTEGCQLEMENGFFLSPGAPAAAALQHIPLPSQSPHALETSSQPVISSTTCSNPVLQTSSGYGASPNFQTTTSDEASCFSNSQSSSNVQCTRHVLVGNIPFSMTQASWNPADTGPMVNGEGNGLMCADQVSLNSDPKLHGQSNSVDSLKQPPGGRTQAESSASDPMLQCLKLADEPGEQKPLPTVDVLTLMPDQLPSDPDLYWRLSEDQRSLLTTLSAAYQDTLLSSLSRWPRLVVFDESNIDWQLFMDDYDMTARDAISFVKRLADFQVLSMNDQISCFKSTLDQVLGVHACYIFLPERCSWRSICGEMSADLAKRFVPFNPHVDTSVQVCRDVKLIAKNDVTLYALLHCILLFDPSCESAHDRQLLSAMRNKYRTLLRHYLEATFSFLYSEDIYTLLQNKLLQLKDLYKACISVTEEWKRIFLQDGFPIEMSQLVRELTDI